MKSDSRKSITAKIAILIAATTACLIAPQKSIAQVEKASDASAAIDKKVDAFVMSELHRQKIPGLSIGVYRDGDIVKAKGYGLENVELNAPATAKTIYESGSMGKQFTATAVMMLVEEGKLSLDDKIKKYFTDAPASWDPITVRNLLTHTSGIKNYTTKAMDYRKDYTEDELVKMAESAPLDFAPGADWSYSNTGFVLLGILIHKVSGEFYGDFLQEHIFKPLGMRTTRIISESDILPNRSAGYQLVKGEWKNQDWVSPSLNTTADGSLYFTVLDLAKWDAALYTENLLKRADLEQMWTIAKLNDGKPNKGNYGFGWFINKMNGHTLVEHGGAWVAGIHDDDLPVRGRQTDRGGADESGFGTFGSGQNRARGRGNLRAGARAASSGEADCGYGAASDGAAEKSGGADGRRKIGPIRVYR